MNYIKDHDCKLETDGTCPCMEVPEWRKELSDEEIYAEDEESIIL